MKRQTKRGRDLGSFPHILETNMKEPTLAQAASTIDPGAIFRLLHEVNQSLLQAVNALGHLSTEATVPRERVERLVNMVEETRAVMNRTIAEHIELHEGKRAGELGRVRY